MHTGSQSQRHSFRYVVSLRLYPCSITGATVLDYLCFDLLSTFFLSTRRSIRLLRFCLAFTMVLLGSLEIALKCTRPRQRFWFMLGGILCQRAGCVKEENIKNTTCIIFSSQLYLEYQNLSCSMLLLMNLHFGTT